MRGDRYKRKKEMEKRKEEEKENRRKKENEKENFNYVLNYLLRVFRKKFFMMFDKYVLIFISFLLLLFIIKGSYNKRDG